MHMPPSPSPHLQPRISTSPNIPPLKYPGLNADVRVNAQGIPGGGQDGEFLVVLREMARMGGLHNVYSGYDYGDSWCGIWPSDTDPTGKKERRETDYFCVFRNIQGIADLGIGKGGLGF